MRARWTMATAFAGALLFALGREAHAQTTLFGTGSAGLTYTDNLYNASSRPQPGVHGRRDAWFVVLTPGVGFTHEAERSSYLLAYSHSAVFYLNGIDTRAKSDTGEAQGTYRLSPVDTLSTSASVARTSTTLLLNSPSSFGLAQETSDAFFNGTAQETLIHEYTANLSGRETISFGVNKPTGGNVPNPWRFTLAGSVGALYQLERDAWTLDWNTTYFHSRSARRGGVTTPRNRYVLTGPAASWRRDLDEEWASVINAGLGVSHWPDAREHLGFVPSWGVALQWQRDVYTAMASYTGGVTPNLFTNQLYFSQVVSLTAAWQLFPEQHIQAFSSHAVTANRTQGTSGAASLPTFYTWTSSAGMRWSPEHLPEVVLSFDHAEQLRTHNAAGLNDYYRNQVSLSIQGRFPEVELSGRREPFRVDGADQPRASESPLITNVEEPAEDS
jgi:hypothetical protein